MFKIYKSITITTFFVIMFLTSFTTASVNNTSHDFTENHYLISNFTVEQASNTSLILKWNILNEIHNLNLIYALHNHNNTHITNLSLNPETDTILVSNLESNTSYDFILQGSNYSHVDKINFGTSTLPNWQQAQLNNVLNKIKQLKTEEYTDISWLHLLETLQLPQTGIENTAYKINAINQSINNLVQIAPVTNFSVNHITNQSIQLFWHPASWIYELQLTYNSIGANNNSTISENLDPHSNTITIYNLQPNTSYQFTLNSTFNNSPAIVNNLNTTKLKALVNANGDLFYLTSLHATTLTDIQVSDLQIMKDEANKRQSSNFTNLSWSNLQNTLNMIEINQLSVNTKIGAISQGLQQLVTVEEELHNAEFQASNLTSANYTNSSWNNLINALNMDNQTKTQIRDKTTAIQKALTYLISVQSDVKLKFVQDHVLNLSSQNYTSDTWYNLQSAMNLPQDTEQEIITKTDTLNNTISSLIQKSTYEEYLQLTHNISSTSNFNYSAQSWHNFSNAQAMPISTQAELELKIDTLHASYENLITIDAANGLNIAKNNIPAVKAYTADSWLNLTHAMNLPENNQSAVLIKTNALNEAVSKLIPDQSSPSSGSSGTGNAVIKKNIITQENTSYNNISVTNTGNNSSVNNISKSEKAPGFGIVLTFLVIVIIFAIGKKYP